jgi:protocatechuate 4,5-dioxygenase, beta chain
MANIVGTMMTSHVPAIGAAIAKGLQQDPYWKPFFDGFPPVREWLARVRPEVVVMVYNDHGLNFFLDKMPTFAVGAAPEYRNADEGWGIPTVKPFRGDPELSWHVIESLIGEEFDIVSCQEMAVDHAFTLPMALCWPDQNWPVRVLPVVVNTVQAPLPSALRCCKLGAALGRAIASWPGAERVLVMGTGGLSHQLDGERAGFINKDFDLRDPARQGPQGALQLPHPDLEHREWLDGARSGAVR